MTAPAGPARSFEGRARAFRYHSQERRSARRERIGAIMAVLVVVLGVFVILTARPFSPSSVPPSPPSGPTIVVHLGTPSVSAITCGGGGTAYAERIQWVGSSAPVTTGDIAIRVYEIWDGDYIGDPNAAPNVSASSLCVGAVPDPSTVWYLVFANPNGTNLLTFTVGQGWKTVTSGPWNFPVENGTTLVLVTNPLLAASGRGLEVFGFAYGSPILGSVPL